MKTASTSNSILEEWRSACKQSWWFAPFFEPLIPKAISHLRHEPSAKRLLHLGCGDGHKTEALRRLGFEVCGIDINRQSIEIAKRNYAFVDFVRGSAEKLPFEDSSIDATFSFSVLQLVDKRRVVSECKRVLKPGGRAVFIENLDGNPWARGYRRLHRLLKIKYPEDQIPLTHLSLSELTLFQTFFPMFSYEVHHLTTPVTLFLPTLLSLLLGKRMKVMCLPAYRALEKLDRILLHHRSFEKYAWHAVIVAEK